MQLVDQSLVKKIEKEFGNVIKIGSDVLDEGKSRHIIPLSPAHDLNLGGGIPEGTWVILTGDPKCGKAQPLSCKVMTPKGFIKMGEVCVGDEVCTHDGGVARVKYINEAGMQNVYKITFMDGDHTFCSDEHIWRVLKSRTGNNVWQNKTTKELIESGVQLSGGNGKKRAKWYVQLPKPIFMEEQDVNIDPYILGLLLGDGCFLGQIIITNTDKEIVNSVSEYCSNNNLELKDVRKENNIAYRLSSGLSPQKKNPVLSGIKNLGLFNKKSNHKFIPECYKNNSIENRLAIVQGLMDTDGEADRGMTAGYSTTSEKLANDMKEILCSLGYMVKISKRIAKCNGKSFDYYGLSIRGDIGKLFRLSRKKNKCIKRKKPELKRSIKSIEYVGRSICRCISLDNEDGLYITDNCIVTHNSSASLQFIANAQKEEHGSRNALYLDTEGRLKPMNLEGIHGLDINKMQIVATEENPLPAEYFLQIAEDAMKNNEKLIVVIDSISNLAPKRDLEEDLSGEKRPSLPKLLSNFVKRMSGIVPKRRHIVVMITHFIADLSMSKRTKVSDGGRQIQYQADTMLEVSYTQPWLDGEKIIGQMTHWKLNCSAAGGYPGTTYKSALRYGYGLDDIYEIIEIALELGVVSKGGAWFSSELFEGKIQGQAKLTDFLRENPDVLEKIKKEVSTLLH